MNFCLRALLLFTLATATIFASDTRAGPAPDLVVTISNNTVGTAFVGGSFLYAFRIESNGDNVPAVFPTGTVVFSVDLPANASYGLVTSGSGAIYSGDIDCNISGNTLTCLSVNNFTLIGNSSFRQPTIQNVMPQSSGPFTVPPAGGACQVDPGNVVAETDEDNNDCDPDVIAVTDPPVISNTAWMGVSMWDNVVRVYDHEADRQVNAVPGSMTSGTQVHAINDIVAHPMTGLLYVFHRYYESTAHRLGTLDPATGISDIADTGVSFHDSAFSPDGTLYAVGRDAVLYTIDL